MKFSIFKVVLISLVVGLLGIKATNSFLSDTEKTTSNTISTATIFVSPSTTPQPSPSPSPTPAPTPGPGSVVINEIMWHGSNDEWIELRNTTDHSINISQWTISNAASGSNPIQINPSTSIAPGGFYLIAKNKNASTINIDPDQPTASVSLLDGGEILILKTDTDQVIDTAFTGSGWFINSSTPRKSVERVSPPGDGTQTSQWQTATTHTNMDGSGLTDEFATPKATNGT